MKTRAMKNVTTFAAITMAAFLISIFSPASGITAYACSLCDAYFAGELGDPEPDMLPDTVVIVHDDERGMKATVIDGCGLSVYEEPLTIELVLEAPSDDGTDVIDTVGERLYGGSQRPEIFEGYGPGYGTWSDTVYSQYSVSFTGPCGPVGEWKLLPITYDGKGVSEQIIYLYTDTVHRQKEELVRRYNVESGKERFSYRITALK